MLKQYNIRNLKFDAIIFCFLCFGDAKLVRWPIGLVKVCILPAKDKDKSRISMVNYQYLSSLKD